MTPVEVYTQIRSQITESNPDFWGETEIYNLMTNGEVVLANETGCTEISSTVSSTTLTREYARPTDALRISRVTWDNTKLKKINFTDIDKIEGDTEDFGDPDYYYEYGANVGLVATPVDVKTIKYYYLQRPAQLTAASTVFTVPIEFGPYLIDYVLYYMYLKDSSIELANVHLRQWQNNLQIAKNQWGSRRALDNYPVVRDDEGYPYTDLGIV